MPGEQERGPAYLLRTMLAIPPWARVPRRCHSCPHRALCTTGLHLKGCHPQRTLWTSMFYDRVLANGSRGCFAGTRAHGAQQSQRNLSCQPFLTTGGNMTRRKEKLIHFFFSFELMLTSKKKKGKTEAKKMSDLFKKKASRECALLHPRICLQPKLSISSSCAAPCDPWCLENHDPKHWMIQMRMNR